MEIRIADPSTKTSHPALMDSIYKRQRHIYDLTRKYFLFGRDELIESLDCRAEASILEIACGTGRNLILSSRRYPTSTLYGLDISDEMLKTATDRIGRRANSSRFTLARGDATDFDSMALFGRSGFDRVFLSYAVSMIPDWEKAVDQALSATAPGGQLHIVDFGQQDRLPSYVQTVLQRWLRKFHVTPRINFETVIAQYASNAGARYVTESLLFYYARYAVIFKPEQ